MNNFIILLAGKSGSGKTTIAEGLEAQYGWTSVQSYTDRAMRYPDEKGHVFVTPERFDMIPRSETVAFSVFDGNRYCATMAQAEENEVYVIDKKGIETFREAYKRNKGQKKVIVVYLDVPKSVCRKRMEDRGDKPKDIESRIKHDREAFEGIEELADVIYEPDLNASPETCTKEFYDLIMERL